MRFSKVLHFADSVLDPTVSERSVEGLVKPDSWDCAMFVKAEMRALRGRITASIEPGEKRPPTLTQSGP